MLYTDCSDPDVVRAALKQNFGYWSDLGLFITVKSTQQLWLLLAGMGSGASIVRGATGLGMLTGNPIALVVEVASNTALAWGMPDIIPWKRGVSL